MNVVCVCMSVCYESIMIAVVGGGGHFIKFFTYFQHSCVYVKRGGTFNETKANKQLNLFVRNKTPVGILYFSMVFACLWGCLRLKLLFQPGGVEQLVCQAFDRNYKE